MSYIFIIPVSVILVGIITMIVAYIKTPSGEPYSIVKRNQLSPELIEEEDFPSEELVLIEYDNVKGGN